MQAPIEIQVVLIAAVTSTIITPLVQLAVDALKSRYDYKRKVAPIVEHARVLRQELLRAPLNPNMKGIVERITVIEQFHDPVFNCLTNHHIKLGFLNCAKHLEARHKQS